MLTCSTGMDADRIIFYFRVAARTQVHRSMRPGGEKGGRGGVEGQRGRTKYITLSHQP
jgi:hypothetical protein